MSAKLPDYTTYWQAGINPKTGLPLKFSNRVCLKEDIKKLSRFWAKLIVSASEEKWTYSAIELPSILVMDWLINSTNSYPIE